MPTLCVWEKLECDTIDHPFTNKDLLVQNHSHVIVAAADFWASCLRGFQIFKFSKFLLCSIHLIRWSLQKARQSSCVTSCRKPTGPVWVEAPHGLVWVWRPLALSSRYSILCLRWPLHVLSGGTPGLFWGLFPAKTWTGSIPSAWTWTRYTPYLMALWVMWEGTPC